MFTAKLRRIAAMVAVGLFVAVGTMGSKCNLGLDGSWVLIGEYDPYSGGIRTRLRCVEGGSQCWTDRGNHR